MFLVIELKLWGFMFVHTSNFHGQNCTRPRLEIDTLIANVLVILCCDCWLPLRLCWCLFCLCLSFLANVNVLRYVCYMLSAVRLSSVCLSSVCLSVCDVGAPYSGVWTFRQFFSPYDSPGTLLFWCQKSLVGDAPFPSKFAFKVTHPLSNSEISTNIGS